MTAARALGPSSSVRSIVAHTHFSAAALPCSWLKRCVGRGHREGAIDASASNALGLSFHARIGVQDDWLRHSEAWLDERAARSYADAASRSIGPFAAAGLAMLELRSDAGGPSQERALRWLSAAAAVGAPELHPPRPWPSMKRLEALFAASRWRLARSSFVSVLGDEFGISLREARALYDEIDVEGVGFVEWSGSPGRCRPPSLPFRAACCLSVCARSARGLVVALACFIRARTLLEGA